MPRTASAATTTERRERFEALVRRAEALIESAPESPLYVLAFDVKGWPYDAPERSHAPL